MWTGGEPLPECERELQESGPNVGLGQKGGRQENRLRYSPAAWESDSGAGGEELQGGGPGEPGQGQRAAAGPGRRGRGSRGQGMRECELARRHQRPQGRSCRGRDREIGLSSIKRTRGQHRAGERQRPGRGARVALKRPRVVCRAGGARIGGRGAVSAPGVGERVGRLRRLGFSRCR